MLQPGVRHVERHPLQSSRCAKVDQIAIGRFVLTLTQEPIELCIQPVAQLFERVKIQDCFGATLTLIELQLSNSLLNVV